MIEGKIVKRGHIAALLLAMLIFPACTPRDDSGFLDRALRAPSGIVETDASGRVINRPADDHDWETSPQFYGIRVEPAYPNPAPFNARVYIPVSLDFRLPVRGLNVEWWVQEEGRLRLIESFDEVWEPQHYMLTIEAQFNGPGLYRVLITDAAGVLISYGDIEVVEQPIGEQ